MEIRPLQLEDFEAFAKIRAYALENNPEAFCASNKEELAHRKSRFEETVNHKDNFMLGAFLDEKLIGIVGFVKETRIKSKHKGFIWGMFIYPEQQNQGIGKKLLLAALAKAFNNPELRQINLSVIENNTNALKLYEKLGFITYGVEKSSLCVNGNFYDEILMSKTKS